MVAEITQNPFHLISRVTLQNMQRELSSQQPSLLLHLQPQTCIYHQTSTDHDNSYPHKAAMTPRPANDDDDDDPNQSIVLPSKFNVGIADTFDTKEPSSWFITSQIPPDLSVQVDQVNFNVHKFPLQSKCGYFQCSKTSFDCDVKLENFPGGSETFEAILKFCYGFPLDFHPKNIAPLRCAAEYLDMTEELDDGNLITKSEAFLSFVVLSSWKDTITVLKRCENLSPWAENLQIVRRCCDSIAWRISRDNTHTDDAERESWWFEGVADLRIDHFTRIVTTIKAKGARPEIIGRCIMRYAERSLPGMDAELEGLRGYGQGKNDVQFCILSRSTEELGKRHGKEQRAVVESLVSLLPPQHDAVSCRFLLQMLKMANVYSASPALISELEKRVGIMLEEASVNDLLIPRYKSAEQAKQNNCAEESTMYDTDLVQRVVEYFLMHEQHQLQQQTENVGISKLLDNYLAEVARDPNLSLTKFQVLTELLPEGGRTCHDGLYRAIDVYFKTHPLLSEHDRRRLCKLMNCNKLSLDACSHAAQNDRLPLRTIVQVLFSEQVKMRATMQEKVERASGNNSEVEGNQLSTDMEIKALKVELENVKVKMTELQSDYLELQQEYDRLGRSRRSMNRNTPRWSVSWRKIKSSFHTKIDRDDSISEELEERPKRSKSSFLRRLSMA